MDTNIYKSEDFKEYLEEKEEDKKEDILERYVYLEDLDGEKVPSWLFISSVQTAENVPEDKIVELARKFGYKIFEVCAYGGFSRTILAAKEIEAEDIRKEYADFLLGEVYVSEIE